MTWIYLPSTSLPSAEESAAWSSLSDWLAFHRGLSLGSKGKPMGPLSWRRAWSKDCWARHLSGMTLPSSTADRGVASWISSLRATRVSPTPSPVLEQGKPTSGGSGMRSGGSFARWNPASCSWKTCQGTFLERSDEFSETWPRAGGLRNGTAFLRRPSAPLTSVIGCSSLLPTPTAMDCAGSGSAGYPATETRSQGMTLTDALVRGFLPTPAARDRKSGQASVETSNRNARPLNEAVLRRLPTPITGSGSGKPRGGNPHDSGSLEWLARKGLIPTPSAADARRGGVDSPRKPGGKNLSEWTGEQVGSASQADGQPSGHLSPYFVEWMMGFPEGWTELVHTDSTSSAMPLSETQEQGRSGRSRGGL